MSIPASVKPRRKLLGCGCSTWLWAIGAFLVITVIAGLLTDGDNPSAGEERSAPIPTFTNTAAPRTDAPAPTDTPLPPTAVPVELPTATPVPPPPPAPVEPAPAPVEAERAAPVVPLVPVAPASALSDCLCDSDIYNCNCDGTNPDCQTFVTTFDAQSCYMRCKEIAGRDIHGLDRDGDGSACEWTWD